MGGLRAQLGRHRWFLALLTLAVGVRVVVVLAFPPGFVFSDGPTYLALVDDLTPLADRTVGYGIGLHLLAGVSRNVSLVVLLQHGLGLATGGLVYALLRRWSVPPAVAALAAAPVLLDAMELVLEHSVLSDVLFDFLVLAGIAALAWHRRPTPAYAATAGLLMGLAVCVRVVGEPLVLAAVLFCVVAGTGLRPRLVTSLAVVAAFLVPVVGYATWYHHEDGAFALSQSSGRALYMRTTTFVDCSRLSLPDYEEALCPEEPIGARKDPTYYGWHDPDGNHGLVLPAGVTPNQAMHDFAVRAIKAQPWDYLRTVGRDAAYTFAVVREDRYEYDTADKWSFFRYLYLEPSDFTAPAYLAHGGELPTVRQPYADLVVAYGSVTYTNGGLLLAMLAMAVGGLVLPRPRNAVRTRPLILLSGVVGCGLVLAPDVTAEFVWRYEMPMVMLLPMSAALAWTRLNRTEEATDDRSEDAQPGTTAAPSTDWPNGGVKRRSRKRVLGTMTRS